MAGRPLVDYLGRPLVDYRGRPLVDYRGRLFGTSFMTMVSSVVPIACFMLICVKHRYVNQRHYSENAKGNGVFPMID